jgi:phytoene/squalene synthetase
MKSQVERAESFYRKGAQLMDCLERDGRRAFGMMMSTYRALLTKIKRHPADVLRHRVRLGQTRKLQIAARWTLLPPRAEALL